MIRSFRSKALADLWNKNDGKGVRPDLVKRGRAILSRLEACKHVKEMSFAGSHLHPPLQGSKTQRYTVSVNGPWRVTFEFVDGDAFHVDLEQYH
jgi:toxin HigB-1